MNRMLEPGRPTLIRPTPSRGLYFLATFFICNLVGAFTVLDRMKYGEWSEKSGGDALTQSLNVLQIIVSIALFWSGYRRSGAILPGAKLLLFLVGFLIVSATWSIDPETSLRRAILYLFVVLGAIGIAGIFSAEEYMTLMKRVVFCFAVASLLVLAFSSSNALMTDGTLRGVFSHKNVFGQILAAGVLASLYDLRIGGIRRWTSAAATAIFVLLGIFTHSGTALMTILAFCAGEIIAVFYRWGGAIRAVMLVVFVTILAVLFFLPDLVLDLILGLLGKDSTLTGRTELWAFVDTFIAQRPLLGWGFGAFWSPTNPLAAQVSKELGWIVPEAHNGLRELLLEVGAVGTLLFLFVFFRGARNAVRSLKTPGRDLGLSFLLCCGGILLVAMTEEVFVDFSQISVSMFFVMGLLVERALKSPVVRRSFKISSPRKNAISLERLRGPQFGARDRRGTTP